MKLLSKLGMLTVCLTAATSFGARPARAEPPTTLALPGQLVFGGFSPPGPDEQPDNYSVSPLGGPTTDVTPDREEELVEMGEHFRAQGRLALPFFRVAPFVGGEDLGGGGVGEMHR